MKLYTISLTITDENNNEQLVQLRAPHLNAKQVTDLTNMTLAGILYEPGQETVVSQPVLVPPKHKKRGVKRLLSRHIEPPIEPLAPTADDLRQLEEL